MWAGSAKVRVGDLTVGTGAAPAEEQSVEVRDVHPFRGFPPKFSLCNLSLASWASSACPAHGNFDWPGCWGGPSPSFPIWSPPPLALAQPSPGCPSLAFPLPDPMPTHHPRDTSWSSPVWVVGVFHQSFLFLGRWNNLCLKLGVPEIQRTY